MVQKKRRPEEDEASHEYNGRNPIQAGCGCLIGVILPFGIMSRIHRVDGAEAAVIIVISAVTCSYLAWRFGDRFWESFRRDGQ